MQYIAFDHQMFLLEQFTSTYCRHCPKGTACLEALSEMRGDIYFTVQVQTPTGLSKQQKEMLSKFEETLTLNQSPKQKKFSEFIRK